MLQCKYLKECNGECDDSNDDDVKAQKLDSNAGAMKYSVEISPSSHAVALFYR